MTINSTFSGRGIASITSCLATIMLLLTLSTGATASPYVFVKGGADVVDIDWTQPADALFKLNARAAKRWMQERKSNSANNSTAMLCFVNTEAETASGFVVYPTGATVDLLGSTEAGNGATPTYSWLATAPPGNPSPGGTLSGGTFATTSDQQNPTYTSGMNDEVVTFELAVTDQTMPCDPSNDFLDVTFEELPAADLSVNNTGPVCSGATPLMFTVDESQIPASASGEQVRYLISVDNPNNFVTASSGSIPTDGSTLSAAQINGFSNLDFTPATTTALPSSITIGVAAFYDYNGSGDLDGFEIAGPVDEITIEVRRQPLALVAPVGFANGDDLCEGSTIEVEVTATPNTTVTYDYDLAASSQTVDVDASGTATVSLVTAGTGSTDDVEVQLTGVAYTDGTPGCDVALAATAGTNVTFDVVAAPLAGDIVLSDEEEGCNVTTSVDVDYSGGTPGTYDFTFALNGTPLASQTVVVNVNGDASNVSVDLSSITDTEGGAVAITLTEIADANNNTACAAITPPSTELTFTIEAVPVFSADFALGDGPSGAVGTTGTISVDAAGVVMSNTGTMVCDGTSLTFSNIMQNASQLGNAAGVIVTAVQDVDDVLGFGGQPQFVPVSATGNLDYVLNVNDNLVGNQTIELSFRPVIDEDGTPTVPGDDACQNTGTATFEVIVQGVDEPMISGDATICSGQSATLSFADGENGTAFYTIGTSATENPVTITSNNTTTVTVSPTETTEYTLVRFVPTASGCSAVLNETVTITVEDLPTGTVSSVTPSNEFACFNAEDQVSIDFGAGDGTGFAYTYTISNGTTTSIVSGSTMDMSVPVPLTLSGDNVTVTLTALSNAGGQMCAGTPGSDVTLSVQEDAFAEGMVTVATDVPTGTAAANPAMLNATTPMVTDLEVCSGGTVTLGFGSLITSSVSVNATGASAEDLFYAHTFTATGTVGGLPASSVIVESGAADADFMFTNTTGMNQTVTVEITPFFSPAGDGSDFATACPASDAYTIEVEVQAIPQVVASTPAAPLCEGETATISLTGPANGSVEINPAGLNGTTTVTLDANGTGSFETAALGATTNFAVSDVTDALGCVNAVPSQFTVFVNPEPVVMSVTAASACLGETGTVTVQTADAVGGTLSFRFTNNGTFPVTVVNGTETVPAGGVVVITTPTLVSGQNLQFNVTNLISSEDCEIGLVNQLPMPVIITPNESPAGAISVDSDNEYLCAENGSLLLTFTRTDGSSDNVTITLEDGAGAQRTFTLPAPLNTPVDFEVLDQDLNNDMSATTNDIENLEENTTFSLVAISDVNGCAATVTGNSVEIFVEEDPTVIATLTIDGTEYVIDNDDNVNSTALDFDPILACSDVDFGFTLAGTPMGDLNVNPPVPSESQQGNLLVYDITITDPGNIIRGDRTFTGVPADGADDVIASYLQTATRKNSTGSVSSIMVDITPRFDANTTTDQCPGNNVRFEVLVQPELTANLAIMPARVCEGATATITITSGPANGSVTVISTAGPDVTISLDAGGAGTAATAALVENTSFSITGLQAEFTTMVNGVNQTIECDRNIDPNAMGAIVAEVLVNEIPDVTISQNPDPVCGGEDVDVTVDGDVTFAPTGSEFDYVYVDSDGDPVMGTGGTGVADANGDFTFTATGLLMDTTVQITEIRTAVIGGVMCTFDVSNDPDYAYEIQVTPRPDGTLTSNSPVCEGETPMLTFNSTAGTGNFNVRVEGPNGAIENFGARNGNANAPGPIQDGFSFPAFDGLGTYTILRVRDFVAGTGPGSSNGFIINCTNNVPTSTVTVEEENAAEFELEAEWSGSSQAQINNTGIFSTLSPVLCDGDDISIDLTGLSTSIMTNGFPLYVEVDFDADVAELGAANFNVNGDPVASGDVFVLGGLNLSSGQLSHNQSTPQTVEITLTPYFENETDDTDLNSEECAGTPIRVRVEVLPDLATDLDVTANSACDNGTDNVVFSITGVPNAEVAYTLGTDLQGGGTFSTVILDASGEATVTTQTMTPNLAMGDYGIELTEIALGFPVNNPTTTCSFIPTTPVTAEATINQVPVISGFTTRPDRSGPGRLICSDETYSLVVTLGNTSVSNGDVYDVTYVVNGNTNNPVTAPGVLVTNSNELVVGPFQAPSVDTDYDLTEVTSAAGCTIDNLTNSLTVLEAVSAPEIEITSSVATDLTNITVCSGELVNLAASVTNPAATGPNVSVSIAATGDIDVAGLTMSPTDLTLANFNTTYGALFPANTTMAAKTVTLTITPYLEDGTAGFGGECDGSAVEVTITVLPAISSTVSNPVVMLKSRETSNVDLAALINTPAGGTDVEFTYTVATDAAPASAFTIDGSSDLLDANRATASDANITDEYVNTTGNIVTVTYTVTPSSGDCQGASFDVEVEVAPEPVVFEVSVDNSICSLDPIGLVVGENTGIASNNAGSVSYSATVTVGPNTTEDVGNVVMSSNVTPFTFFNGNALTGEEFVNNGPTDETVTYTITPTFTRSSDNETFIGQPVEFAYDVAPTPDVLPAIAGSDNGNGGQNVLELIVCSGSTFTQADLIDLVTANGGGVISDGFRRRIPAGNINDIVVEDLLDNFDIVPFCATQGFQGDNDTGGGPDQCILRREINSDVNDRLTISTATPVTVWYDISVGDDCAGSTFPDGDFQNNFNTLAGTFVTVQVTVVPAPTVTLSGPSTGTDFCSGDILTLNTAISGGAPNPTFDYEVEMADPGVVINFPADDDASSIDITGSGVGNATIRVTVDDGSGGCNGVGFLNVSVGNTPTENPIVGAEQPCAGPNPTTYSVTTPDPNSTYAWSISGPGTASLTSTSGASIGVNFGTADGPYVLTVVEESLSGCTTTNTLDIEVVSAGFADFNFTIDANDPLTVLFEEAAGGNISQYRWDFDYDGVTPDFDVVGNGPAEQNPTFMFPTAGSYDVLLEVRSQCDPFQAPIEIQVVKTVTVGPGIICQTLNLNSGLNFISLEVIPTQPNFGVIFGGQPVASITTYKGGSPLTWEPSAGDLSDIVEFERAYGYLINATAATSVQICGMAEDGSVRNPLNGVVNLIGTAQPTGVNVDPAVYYAAESMLPNPDMNIAYSFLDGPFNRFYEPGGGALNDLTELKAGFGYVVIMNNPNTPPAPIIGANGDVLRTSESAEFVKGRVSGTAFDFNQHVEVFTQDGALIGLIEAGPDGRFGPSAIFGEVSRPDGQFIDGAQRGEQLIYRHNGVDIAAPAAFNGGFIITAQELVFDADVVTEVVEEFAFSVAPNPLGTMSQVNLDITARGTFVVNVVDVNGRLVQTIVNKTALEAGAYSFPWNTSELANGVYLITVTKDGELMSELSLRAIKQ